MTKSQEEFAKQLAKALGAQITPSLNIDFIHHVPKLLRLWADQIESGEITAKSANIIFNPDQIGIQNIHIVTTIKQVDD